MKYLINSPKNRGRDEHDAKAISSARVLWELSFQDDAAFLDLYFGKLVKANEIYLLEEEPHKAIAHIHADQFALHLYDSERVGVQGVATYISGACTHPKHRGKGAMQQLMQAVLCEEAERGHLLCMLIPADQDLRSYYQKHFGFETRSYAYTTESELLAVGSTYRKTNNIIEDCHTPIDVLYNGERGIRLIGVWHSREDWAGIVEQYQQTKHTWLRTIPSASNQNDIDALALGRTEKDGIYIDALVGDDTNKRKLIEIIRNESAQKPLIFALPHRAEGNVRIAPRGMVRPANCPRLMNLYAHMHPKEVHSFSLSDEIIPSNTGYYELKNGQCVFIAGEIQLERLITLHTFIHRFVPELSMQLMND